MNSFLQLPRDRQRLIYEQAAARIGILPESVEKDFWVSLMLETMFSHPELAPHLTFKGGTSLSKAWKLIRRFSEDIDLVIDKGALENVCVDDYYTDAEKKPSRGKLKKLALAGKEWVQGAFRNTLVEALQTRLQGILWTLEVDSDVEDGMCLLFTYPSVWEQETTHDYIRKVVKIEMGPQPDNWPSVSTELRPMIFETFPQLSQSAAFSVRTIEPKRTLWEKALLLHEIAVRANHPDHAEKRPKQRMSRHYYDLCCLLRSLHRQAALDDAELFASIVRHRSVYFKITGVDYATMQRGRLSLMPHPSHRDIWLDDFKKMQETMIYDPACPSFDEILAEVKLFEDEFNRG